MKRFVGICLVSTVLVLCCVFAAMATPPTGSVTLTVNPDLGLVINANCNAVSGSFVSVEVTLQRFLLSTDAVPVSEEILFTGSPATPYNGSWNRIDNQSGWYRAKLSAVNSSGAPNSLVTFSAFVEASGSSQTPVSTMSTIGWIALAVVLVGLAAVAVKFGRRRTNLA